MKKYFSVKFFRAVIFLLSYCVIITAQLKMSKCFALYHTMKRWNIFEGTACRNLFVFVITGLCSI